MQCPENTVACKVRLVGKSKETVGSPATPAYRYYECELHGYLTHDVERNALARGLPEGVTIEPTGD